MRVRPALITVATFLGLIVLGTVAVALVPNRASGHGSLVTAAFTATSAVCVTGLTVVDLAREMDFGGQLLVLVLLQIGGLGVLTVSNWILLTVRRRSGIASTVLTGETYGGIPSISPRELLQRVVLFTFVTEALGALVLYLRFSQDAPAPTALWQAVFHAVSAFCNAGFSIFGDSLHAYRGDVVVNGTIVFLVIAGGIGFVAATDVTEWVRRRIRGDRRRLYFHTRVVLVTSGGLIAFGFVAFLVFEWANAWTGHSAGNEILESFFLSVTARTAGFNTVDTGHLTNMSLLVLLVLMVIGASPGSTGGGVKTSTMAIIWARVRSFILNRPNTELLGHTVPHRTTAKAMAILMIYILVAMLALLAIQATEFGGAPHERSNGAFLDQLFEVISALSTVGLSTGITRNLTDPSLGILMVCMFVGRVGPLVLAASLIGERPRLPYAVPEADVMVG
ncbi:MAG: TrkH family potassium uptake protein [Planctomycetota bacterium]